MTKKRRSSANAKAPEENPNLLLASQRDGETQAETIARHSIEPKIQGALSIKHFESQPLTGGSINVVVRQLAEQIKLSNQGDLSRSEALLTVQAHTLNAIFHKLARVAAANLSENVDHFDTLLRLALKAQSQCRSTIETLAEIKNPAHVAFVKQANIANGPQQVNNGHFETSTRAGTRAEKSENQQSKLLEQSDGERLELGTQGSAIGANTPLETVGAVDRTDNNGGQG